MHKVRVCIQRNCEVNYNMDMHVHTCFSAAAVEGEDGAICAGYIPGSLLLPAPSPPFLPFSRSINSFYLQKQFEASLKTLQEEDERCVGLTKTAQETIQEMLVSGGGVHHGGQTASFPLQHPPPPPSSLRLESVLRSRSCG